ncbi:MAG: SoxR reducing system RseC family protein [Solirubrobacterales bacterium]
MKKEQVGIVVEVHGNMAKVRATRHGDCKNCGACPGDNAMILDARNPIGAKVGQNVTFEIQEVNMLQAAFIVYILPLVAIFLGAMAGGYAANNIGSNSIVTFQVIGGIIAFALSVLYIKFFDKSARNDVKMQPVITNIV